jgi:hypothetical protein
MYNWSKLQTEFDALSEGLKNYRVDYQWGVAGVIYRLAGGVSSDSTRRFKVLADIAGKKLQELPNGTLNKSVIDAPDPESQWYETLRHHSDAFKFGFVGHQTNDAGDNLGNIFTGSVDRPADSSALVCLKFSEFPTVTKPSETANKKTIVGQLNGFLKHEKERRGSLWFIIGFIIMATLTILSL